MILLILSQQEPPQPQDQVLQVKCTIQYYTKMIKHINQIIKHMKEINFFKDRRNTLLRVQLNSRKNKIYVACLQQALLFE